MTTTIKRKWLVANRPFLLERFQTVCELNFFRSTAQKKRYIKLSSSMNDFQ